MAKEITQETVNKAVGKATTAENKRCIAIIKGMEHHVDTKPKSVVKEIVAALKA